jgi:hypothetical protein
MRWILGPLFLLGCKGGKDDSASGGDDTGSPDTGATHVTAMTVGTMGPDDIDAIEIIHVVGGAFAELTNVPEFNYLIEGALPPKAAPPPPPIGELACIENVRLGDEEVLITFDKCEDDRSGSVHLQGVSPTTVEFQGMSVFGYTIDGSMVFTVSGLDPRYYDFVTAGAKKVLGVEGNGRSVEFVATGSVFPDFFKPDGVMLLNEDVTVTESGTTRTFLVGNGSAGLSLQPPSPLTWSLEASTPRRPINGTISFTATTGSYLASITAETLQSEIGIPKESVPLAGIQDIPLSMDTQPRIGITYAKSDLIGIQTELDIYAGTVQTSEIVALAEKCVLSQADCDTLAAGIDDTLADEVTVDVDSSAVISAFGIAYGDHFDPTLLPTK